MAKSKKKRTNTYEAGGLLDKITQVAGAASPLIGAGLGLAKGVMGIIADKKAAEVAEKQEMQIEKANTQTRLAGMTSKGGKAFNAAEIEVNPLTAVNSNALGGFNPTRDLEEYNVGGSHEQNPNGGIQVGIGQNGKPNTIEEGETSFDIEGEKFIYSAQVPFVPSERTPSFVKGDTPAAATKSVEKAFFGRNDPYSIATKKEIMGEIARIQETTKQEAQQTGQQSNQFVDGGGVFGLPGRDVSVNPDMTGAGTFRDDQKEGLVSPEFIFNDPNAWEKEYGQYSEHGVLGEGSTKDETWLERNKDKLQTGALVAGVGSQLAGVVSNVRSRNQLQQAAPITAETLDPNQIKSNLVNRQDILREVNRSQQSAIGALGVNAAGNFGAYAANVAGIQGKTSEAISTAMMQSDTLDAQELARVQEGQAGIRQFNAKMRMAAAESTAQNLAAYEGQRASYSRGIAANIGSLGQSLINYVTGTKFAEYEGQTAGFETLGEDPYKYSRRRKSNNAND